jgi:hypothetical protein
VVKNAFEDKGLTEADALTQATTGAHPALERLGQREEGADTLDAFSLVLQGVACATTFSAMWLMGNKKTIGPALGVLSDIFFFAVNVYAGLWLCAAFCATLTVVHVRNFLKWRREEKLN